MIRHKTVEFILPGKAEIFEVKVMKVLDFIFDRVIKQFGDKGMDVRVPLEITAKSVNGSDHTKDQCILEIAEEVVIVLVIMMFTGFTVLSFQFSVESFIGDFGDSIACSHEKKIQSRAVTAEIGPVVFGDSENNMSVRSIHTESFGFSS